jgi:hypothetical protein
MAHRRRDAFGGAGGGLICLHSRTGARMYVHGQHNIIGVQAAGGFTGPQQAAYVAAVQWIGAMRAAAATIAATGADPDDNANWPACPPDVAALAAAFGGGQA